MDLRIPHFTIRSLLCLRAGATLLLALAVALTACGDNGVSADPDSEPDVSVTASFTVDPDDPKVGDEVALDAGNSSVEGADELSFDWALSPPSGSEAEVEEPNSETTSFTADTEGTYEVTLKVSADGTTDSASEDVDVEEEEEASRVLWSRDLGISLTSEPAIGPDGSIYVSTEASPGVLVAFDDTGEEKWREEVRARAPTVSPDGNTVYVGTYRDRTLHAFNAKTGETRWTFDDNGELGNDGDVAIDDDGILYLSGDELYALDSEATDDADRKLWQTEEGSDFDFLLQPAVDKEASLVYVNSTDGRLFAFSTENGEKQWDVTINSDDRSVRSSPAIGQDGTVYVGSADGALYAITPKGEVDWIFDEIDHLVDSEPVISPDGEHIYVITNPSHFTEDERLYAIDTEGNEAWKTSGTSASLPSAGPVVGDDGTIYTNIGEDVIALDPEEVSLEWRFETDDFVTAGPVMRAGDGTLYVASEDGHVYALETGSDGLSELSPWPTLGKNAQRGGLAN